MYRSTALFNEYSRGILDGRPALRPTTTDPVMRTLGADAMGGGDDRDAQGAGRRKIPRAVRRGARAELHDIFPPPTAQAKREVFSNSNVSRFEFERPPDAGGDRTGLSGTQRPLPGLTGKGGWGLPDGGRSARAGRTVA